MVGLDGCEVLCVKEECVILLFLFISKQGKQQRMLKKPNVHRYSHMVKKIFHMNSYRVFTEKS